MTRFLTKIIGLILLITGIYFFGQSIIFTTAYYSYFYGGLAATGSVLALMCGVFALVFFRPQTGNFGWVLLGIGIILVFLSGRVILQPTSLWNFLVSFTALAVGYQLLSRGRINL
jgi:hypothetical protein